MICCKYVAYDMMMMRVLLAFSSHADVRDRREKTVFFGFGCFGRKERKSERVKYEKRNSRIPVSLRCAEFSR